jgi:hypothetical protein
VSEVLQNTGLQRNVPIREVSHGLTVSQVRFPL